MGGEESHEYDQMAVAIPEEESLQGSFYKLPNESMGVGKGQFTVDQVSQVNLFQPGFDFHGHLNENNKREWDILWENNNNNWLQVTSFCWSVAVPLEQLISTLGVFHRFYTTLTLK